MSRTKMGSKLLAALFGVAVTASVIVTGCGTSATATPEPSPTTASQPTKPAVSATPATGAAATATVPGSASPASGGSTAGLINGAGATFPYPLYSKWFDEYAKIVSGVKFNYQSVGSGAGIKQITDKTVDFGASDAPMTDEQLKAAPGILHIPTVLGAVVVTYNLPDVTGKLQLTADTVAGIFLGTITKWNDPKIAADNASLKLPDQDILVVHRSDGSGTTNMFTDYLTKASADWKSKVGTGTSVNWPVGLGGKGNEGVAGQVKQQTGSIGYVELVYTIQNKLPYASIKNQAGTFVDPSVDSVTAAAAGAISTMPDDLRVSITNSPGAQAYPIAGFTYLLVYQEQADQAKGQAIVNFLWWATHDGQKFAPDLAYATLPKEVVTKVEGKIKSITFQGKPLYAGQ